MKDDMGGARAMYGRERKII